MTHWPVDYVRGTNISRSWRIRSKARVDLSGQTAQFYTFKVISTTIEGKSAHFQPNAPRWCKICMKIKIEFVSGAKLYHFQSLPIMTILADSVSFRDPCLQWSALSFSKRSRIEGRLKSSVIALFNL